MGETMALFSSRSAGVLRSGARVDFSVGGAESNVAIGLTRLDVPVAWIGRVGVDPFGDEVVRVIRGEGVEVLASRDAIRRTGLMVKERRTALHQRVTYYRSDSAGSALSVDDVDDQVVGGARVLHVTGITPALSESAAAAVDHAIRIAREAGATVSLDINYRSALWSRAAAKVALTRLLASVDILFAGLDEAELLTGRAGAPEQAAADLILLGPSEVVVKHGASGATAVADGGPAVTAAPPAVPVVDTVGAGDAFVAGYLAGHLAGDSVQRRLELGCATGAFACMSDGDWEGAPTRAELALLNSPEPVLR